MPRNPRWMQPANHAGYHFMSRGHHRETVFADADDSHYFLQLLERYRKRYGFQVNHFCLMTNHFHFVLWPAGDTELAAWMHWLLTTHVSRHNRRYRVSGHVWQGRFHAFPIQEDEHLLTVLRYVERNPLRANLVERAEGWAWSSLRQRLAPASLPFLHPSPVPLPPAWLRLVHEAQTQTELERLRHSVRRGTPCGGDAWVRATAGALGLEYTLLQQGRPPTSAAPKPPAQQPSLFAD